VEMKTALANTVTSSAAIQRLVFDQQVSLSGCWGLSGEVSLQSKDKICPSICPSRRSRY
jgi:hypothetical protein